MSTEMPASLLPYNLSTGTSANASMEDKADDDMEMARKLHWISSTIFGITFVLVGILGNILSILVWSRKNMASSTGTYLIIQAAIDIVLLLLFVLTDTLTVLFPQISVNTHYGRFYALVGYPFFYLAVILSIWMLVAVTVDRYIQVSYPTRVKDLCNKQRVLLVAFLITCLCFIVNIPHFRFYQPHCPSNASQNEKAFILTDFGRGKDGLAYALWVHCIFLVLVPWIAILALNILILRHVLISRKRAKLDKRKMKDVQMQLTRILLTVTFAFLFLLVWQCVTQCFYMIQPVTADKRVIEEAFSLAKLGIIINSSMNFFLYCLGGSRFRQELSVVLDIRCRRYSRRIVPVVTRTSNGTRSSKV